MSTGRQIESQVAIVTGVGLRFRVIEGLRGGDTRKVHQALLLSFEDITLAIAATHGAIIMPGYCVMDFLLNACLSTHGLEAVAESMGLALRRLKLANVT
ncbi:hypothetical protein ALQ37_200110 [Pseudomonas syringae pv. aptata]|uniref:Uncharacterized protein n=2 Tax=Pseudomonas syringae TaxID=317 RepID=A0A3M3WI73_PSEAP|nr:hypothetical protein ALQ37_200110 [Pseudomonas syringae pv. aptata]